MIDLSIVIVSYNTQKLLLQCLNTLNKTLIKSKLKSEIIIVDNASIDKTKKMLLKLRNKITNLKFIFNNRNVGFGQANNQGIKIAKGKYILLLNSDVFVNNLDFNKLINYLKNNPKIGVLTVKVILPNGKLDMACHRGFPSPWRSFCYFSKLEKFLGFIPFFSRIFGGYHLLDKDFNKIHFVEAISGAFFLVKKEVINKTGGFDKDFFMYGEDLDLCWRINKKGYKIVFYPYEKVVHYKYQSGLASKKIKTKSETREFFYESMKIFYKKHYASLYPKLFNNLIYSTIDFIKKRC